MVMADDENSDFVGNAAEQKVIKGTAANSLASQGNRCPANPPWRCRANPLPSVKS